MSPMAKMPGVWLSNRAVSTGIRFSCRLIPNSAMGPSLMVSPEERQERIGLVMPLALVGAGQGHAGQLARLAMQRLDAGDMKLDLSLGFQLAHLIDAVLRRAKAVAVMDQGQRLRQRRQIDGPVQRG